MNTWIKPMVKRNGVYKQDRSHTCELVDGRRLLIEWVGSGKQAYRLSFDGEEVLGHFPTVKAAKDAAEQVAS
jgi:hypothetical protein